MERKFAIYKTKLGYLKIDYSNRGITGLSRIDNYPIDKQVRSSLTDKTAQEISEYLEGTRCIFDVPLSFEGTPFQIKVWNLLLKIPYGETRTYQEIAVDAGNPKACKAVGMACNKNPIVMLIPCHRVIGKNKKLTGYAGGLEMKRFLLNLEQGER